MRMLTNEVAETEYKVAIGAYSTREIADTVYRNVSEKREELYYGGGYKSWFSTSPKPLQIALVIISLAVIIVEAFIAYNIWWKSRYEEAKQRDMFRL